MSASFYFYDLETSGFNPRQQRIMQFGGQRTDMDLNPVGEPDNFLIKLTEDVLPDPEAVLLTGITPQKTLAEGVTEAEFLKVFASQIAMPGTIFVGYNNVRFDDEFMRFIHYRNFYDAYEWQWQGGRSKWDLLDVVRMTRALRPAGINWPVNEKGQATNRLELLTKLNNLDHDNAHDALADVMATISVAKLIREKQPKLFDFLLEMRDKKKIAPLVLGDQPFIYASGKYANEFEKTTVATAIAEHPQKKGALVYDLRHDPAEFAELSPKELAERWSYTKDGKAPPRLPVKTLQFNHCPALAPLGVLDSASQRRLNLDLKLIEANRAKLKQVNSDFAAKVLEALKILDDSRQKKYASEPKSVDGQLYDGFFSDADRQVERQIQNSKPEEVASIAEGFRDERLKKLLPLYKARNFSASLTDEERSAWEQYRRTKLLAGGKQSRLAQYVASLQTIASETTLNKTQEYLLEELKLYAEAIMPTAADA
ncbi:MAG: exodeoxyribonuclease I [Candidatus Saccharimonadales bacterium]